MTPDELYAPAIETAFQRLLMANGKHERLAAGSSFTRLIRARNAERSATEIRKLERQKGLR